MKILDPIFSNDEMFYCSVPVPDIDAHKGADFEFTATQISQYGQSHVHPSIIFIEGGWNGHEYWLCSTPYPHAMGAFENPCIYYGDADEDGNPPRVFTPISGTANGNYTIVDNPVVKVPNNTWINSDPDLYFDADNQIMYLLSRSNMSTPNKMYLQKSVDGQSWTERDESVYAGMPGQPSWLNIGGEMHIIATSAANAQYDPFSGLIAANCNGVFVVYKGSLEDVSSFSKVKDATLKGKKWAQPYHSACFTDPDTGLYYAIFVGTDLASSRKRVYLAESEDGYNWYVFARPLLAPCNMSYAYYRPTACVRSSDRMLVVYWTTQGGNNVYDADYYPNGESDVPVDGFAIGVSYKNFDTVLRRLKEDAVTNIV